MELQEKPYSCGPAALRAAMYVYGKSVTEAAIRRIACTTPEGTDAAGLKRALQHYRFRCKQFQTTSVREATDWLKRNLNRGVPSILCTDEEDHWCAAVGMMGKRIMLFDPEPSWRGYRAKYSGIIYYLPSELALSRWASHEDGQISFYGMSVYPPKEE